MHLSKANKEADQIAKEMVASARQANQKEILVARRAELEATLASARAQLGDASLAGRASLLKSLVKKAGGLSEGKMIMRPTTIDRSALEDAAKDYKMGDDVDGLGLHARIRRRKTLFRPTFRHTVGRSVDSAKSSGQ